MLIHTLRADTPWFSRDADTWKYEVSRTGNAAEAALSGFKFYDYDTDQTVTTIADSSTAPTNWVDIADLDVTFDYPVSYQVILSVQWNLPNTNRQFYSRVLRNGTAINPGEFYREEPKDINNRDFLTRADRLTDAVAGAPVTSNYKIQALISPGNAETLTIYSIFASFQPMLGSEILDNRFANTLTLGFDGVDRYGYVTGSYGALDPDDYQGTTITQLIVDDSTGAVALVAVADLNGTSNMNVEFEGYAYTFVLTRLGTGIYQSFGQTTEAGELYAEFDNQGVNADVPVRIF